MRSPFLAVLAGLSLTLTACPRYEAPEVSTSSDTRMLQGRWKGTLFTTASPRKVVSGNGYVYALSSYVGGSSLEAFDVTTGTRRAIVRGLNIQDIAVRNGEVLVLGGGNLSHRDPATLAERSSRPLEGTYLSVDGLLSIDEVDGALVRRSVDTGQIIPTAHALAFNTNLSSDAGWQLNGQEVVRTSDGLVNSAASVHGDPCQQGGNFSLVHVEQAPAGGYLLGWSDGTIEHYAADGVLLATLNTSVTCAAVTDLYSDGTTVNAALINGVLLQIDVTTGKVLNRIETGLYQVFFVGKAGAVWSNHLGETHFQPWVSPSWTMQKDGVEVSLDALATWTSSQTATVTGNGLLNGQPVTFSGNLRSQSPILVQTSYASYRLEAALTLRDATGDLGLLTALGMVSSFPGIPSAKDVSYTASWHPADQSGTYSGVLRRP